MKKFLLVFLTALVLKSFAQDSTSAKVNFSGYVDVYFAKDFSEPKNQVKQNYIYNHKRTGAVALNLAFIKANVEAKNYRANLALMIGDYPHYNLSNEPNLYQNILEANAGVKLSKTKNLWLDVGVMPSHIGFESVVSADCPTLTRSIVAENSPYFETGAKISYTSNNNKFTAAALYLNGWQNIEIKPHFYTPNFGVQLNYKPNNKWQFNYSNFIGSLFPDTQKITRVYHNFYSIYQPNDNLTLTTGLDIGFQNNFNWIVPIVIVRNKIASNSWLVGRYEYFNDKNEQQIQTYSGKGFNVNAFSLGYDYVVQDNCLIRIECKHQQATEDIFDATKSSNFSFTTGISVKL